MPNAPVSVEIAPPESNDALRAALLDACTRTVKDAECVESAPESTPPSVVAIVSFRDPQNVHLEVAVRPEPQWVVRDIRFAPGDPVEERWRAVGLVIGTLASVMTRKDAPAVTPPPEPTPVVPAKQPEPQPRQALAAPASPARSGWLTLGPMIGTALDTGPLRLGGELSGHLHFGGGVHGTAGFGASQTLGRVADVRAVFTEAFAGIAFNLTSGRSLGIVGRVEAFVERFAPSVSDGANAPTSGERWLAGARLGADLVYWGTGPVGAFVGVTARVASGATDVRVAGQVVGVSPAVGGQGRAGVVVWFD